MKLYYTGAAKLNAWQADINKSLGGYPSECTIPNDTLSNLLSEISEYAARQGLVEVKAIVLKNTSGVVVNNVTLYHTYPANCLVKLEWGVESLNSNFKLSSILNIRETPMGVVFSEPKTVGTKLSVVSSFPPDAMIGFWCRRTIILPNPIDAITTANLEAYVTALIKTEKISVKIDWT